MTKRILWINTVGVSDYDRPIADLLARIKAPDTEVEIVSLDMPAALPHVEYRSYEALTYADIVRLAADRGARNYDAMIIGCFYDPAFKEAREVSGEMVVVAPCIATVQIATTLANRFSVIIVRDKCAEQMTQRIAEIGALDKLASMRALDLSVDKLQQDHELTMSRIKEAARKAVHEDKAEAIILGCTVEFGFMEDVQRELGVPVLDAVCAPFKMAEYMAGLKNAFGWTPSRVWSCEAPPQDELRRLGLFSQSPSVGNSITV